MRLRLCNLWLISREIEKLKHSCEWCKKRSIKIALVQLELQRLHFSTAALWLCHVQNKWVNSLWQSPRAQSILSLQCPEAAKQVSKPAWLGMLPPPAKGVQQSHLEITKDSVTQQKSQALAFLNENSLPFFFNRYLMWVNITKEYKRI